MNLVVLGSSFQLWSTTNSATPTVGALAQHFYARLTDLFWPYKIIIIIIISSSFFFFFFFFFFSSSPFFFFFCSTTFPCGSWLPVQFCCIIRDIDSNRLPRSQMVNICSTNSNIKKFYILPQNVILCCIWISKQRAIFFICDLNCLILTF